MVNALSGAQAVVQLHVQELREQLDQQERSL